MYRKITSHWLMMGSHFSQRKWWRRRPPFPTKLAAVGWWPHFPTKLAAAASFSYKISGGSKDLETLLAAVLAWSGYGKITNIYTLQALSGVSQLKLGG